MAPVCLRLSFFSAWVPWSCRKVDSLLCILLILLMSSSVFRPGALSSHRSFLIFAGMFSSLILDLILLLYLLFDLGSPVGCWRKYKVRAWREYKVRVRRVSLVERYYDRNVELSGLDPRAEIIGLGIKGNFGERYYDSLY